MNKTKQIADYIEEAVDKMLELGTTPHVVICSKKTFEKLSLYFCGLGPFIERYVSRQIWFRYEFGDLPLLKFKYCPEDRVFVLDKDSYEKLMKETKGKLSFSPYYKKEERKLIAATCPRRGSIIRKAE